jgi:hypothetical protein
MICAGIVSRVRRVVPLLLLMASLQPALAQVSAGGTPPSFRHALAAVVPTVSLPAPDVGRFLAEDEAADKTTTPWRFGAPIPVELDLQNAGVWAALPDGGRVWRLRLASPGAYSLNIQYDRFHLPPGAEFFLSSDDQSQVIGAFTEYNSSCSVDGSFATQPLPGDAVVLEYYEPAWAAFTGEIRLSSVVHAYRNVFGRVESDRGYGDSGSCNNNVNCPEGAPWQTEKRAVVMILTSGGSALCSGSLVNNTAQDLRQYFLTANHCGVGTGSNIFVFNYESPGCANQNVTYTSVTGCTLRATNTASDFTLVELNENIPASYNAHFAGWSAIDTPSTSNVGIHHPSGDIKKISFDSQAAISDRYLGTQGIANSHWKVGQWEDGTTEGGSSGSPLFDQNHRIIGQLHGGYASCSSITSDWYGKFSMSWNYGGSASSRLMEWLDPLGLNPGVLDGVDDAPPTVPLLALAGVSVVDGNDGALDPGESPVIIITLANSGAAASGITAVLSESSPYVTVTDANGAWPDIPFGGSAASTNSFSVHVDPATPVGHVVSFSLAVSANGGYATTLAFNLASGLTAESFETGDFSAWNWTQGGNLPWTVVSDVTYQGTRAARSGAITHNQTSSMTLALQVASASTISFAYRVSSEANYDYLRFYIDGVQQAQWSGSLDWTVASYPVAAGARTFTWTYSKDGSVNTGSDCAWVDEIILPALGQPLYPDIAVTPTSITKQLAPGQTGSETVSIANTGQAELSWSAAITTSSLQSGIPTLKLAKGEEDPRVGTFDRAAGGPDAYGYRWKDSNEAGGPAYAWVDISGTGVNAGTGDDAMLGPFGLGFDFDYYGTTYTAVRICTNGFLSFTSTSTAYTNQGIPLADEPNNLIAPFWDDINVTTAGMLKYRADAANQRFIVSWLAAPRYNTSEYQTFQVILHADGRIVYQYQSMNGTLNSATVGIENAAGTDGLQVVFNAPYVTNGLAVELAVEETWLGVTPLSGTVVPGGSGNLTLSFDASALEAGTYAGQLSIASNDPDENPVLVPVTLIVGAPDNEAPIIVLDCLEDTWSEEPRLVTALITDASGVAAAHLRFTINGGGEQSVSLSPAGPDLWSGQLPGVAAPGVVSYRVSAVDASPNANSAETATCSYLVLALDAPQLVISTMAGGQIQLDWSAVDGAASYHVYVSIGQGEAWNLILSTAATSAQIPAAANQLRLFQVRAVN